MAKNANALFLRPYLLRRGLEEIRSARLPICPGWTGDMCGIFSSPWGGLFEVFCLGGLSKLLITPFPLGLIAL